DRENNNKDFFAILNTAENSETNKAFDIKISETTLNNIKDFKLISLASHTNINGFRPGKAPISVVWKQHQDSLTSEIINQSINSIISIIRQKLNAQLISSPNIEVKEFGFDKGLELKVNFDVIPEFELPDLKAISITKPVFEINEKDIAEKLKEMAKIRKNFVSADEKHKAKIGDQVIIDFEGKIDGVAFEGGAAKAHQLELGSKSFIDNFEDQLVGSKKGDQLVVAVKFPENYHEKTFAGKQAEFAVTVQEVKKLESFKDDEELAKSMGHDSLEAFKVILEKLIKNECDNVVKVKVKTELFDNLDKQVKIKLPQVMVDEEFQLLWKQAESMIQDGAKNDKSKEELEKEYKKLAERRIKLGIVLTKFASKFNVSIEQEDYVNAVRAQINSQHPSLAQSIIQYYNQNPKAVESLKGPILEEKTVDLILKDLAYTDKNTSVKDLLKAEKEE
ncbi:MAG: trigger factor, partial [Pseudomonadota bacterium]